MATYYIDPSQPANGTGTQLDPFNTWASVTWAAGNGYFQKCGTIYSTTLTLGANGASGNLITIGSYGTGEKPIINSASGQCFIGFGKQYFSFSGFNCVAKSGVTAIHVATSSNFTIDSNDASGGSNGIYADRTSNGTITNNALSGHNVGITLSSTGAIKCHDISVDDNSVKSCTSHGILLQFGGTAATDLEMYNIELSNNYVEDNAGLGIYCYCALSTAVAPTFWNVGADSEAYHAIHNLQILNNTCLRNAQGGIGARNIHGPNQGRLQSKIAGNYCSSNSVAGTLGGIWTAASYNLIIEKNTSTGNATNNTYDGAGIFIDHQTVSATVRKNYCANNKGSSGDTSGQGIAVFDVQNADIYGNICVGNKQNIWISHASTTNVNLYNNTLISADAANIRIESLVVASQVTIKNTISSSPATYHVYRAGQASIAANYNSYYPIAGNLFYWNASAVSFADWKTATSQDANSITTDPQLDNNYRPVSTSPARNIGTYIQDVYDYYGKSLRSPPDIGAIQYQPATNIETTRSVHASLTDDSTRGITTRIGIRG